MKKSIKRDILIYSISFGVIIFLNLLRTNKNILSETNRIFYFIGTEMYFLSKGIPFLIFFSVLLLTAMVALPIIYFKYDIKVSKRFRKINILWILWSLAVFIYFAMFLSNTITTEKEGILLLINDFLLLSTLGIFLIDGYLRIKEKKSNVYDILNFIIKVYLFLFMVMKAYEIGSLVSSTQHGIVFILLSINIFSDICFFLSLYSLTRFIESQKNNDKITVKTLIVNQSYRFSAVAIIIKSIYLGLVLFYAILSKNNMSFLTYAHSLLKNPQTIILIGVFLIGFAIRLNYKGKIIKYVEIEQETAPLGKTAEGKETIQSDAEENNLTRNMSVDTRQKPSVSTVCYIDNEIKGGKE